MWATSLLLAIALFLISLKIKHRFLVPVYYSLLPLLFYFLVLLLGIELGTLREQGWLFNFTRTEAPFYTYWTYFDMTRINTKAIVACIPTILSLVFFGVLHVPIVCIVDLSSERSGPFHSIWPKNRYEPRNQGPWNRKRDLWNVWSLPKLSLLYELYNDHAERWRFLHCRGNARYIDSPDISLWIGVGFICSNSYRWFNVVLPVYSAIRRMFLRYSQDWNLKTRISYYSFRCSLDDIDRIHSWHLRRMYIDLCFIRLFIISSNRSMRLPIPSIHRLLQRLNQNMQSTRLLIFRRCLLSIIQAPQLDEAFTKILSNSNVKFLILDLEHVTGLDFTVLELIKRFKRRGLAEIFVCGLHDDRLKSLDWFEGTQ